MTRAVLGDAIALIRGDRYYTTDFSREFSVYISYKTSMFRLLQRPILLLGDIKIPSVILTMVVLEANVRKMILTLTYHWRFMYAVPKLLMRHLPHHYPYVSYLWLILCLSIRWTRLTELGLRLLPLLHSPEDEGKFDQAKTRWSIHVHSPRAYPNPKGT